MTMSLGDRMKGFEYQYKSHLPKKSWAVIRIDGKAFHTFTRKYAKPFSWPIMVAMNQTLLALCEQIQGVTLGYTQSDEISLILTDTNSENTDWWFGGNIQKITSVSASIATAVFNREIEDEDDALFDSRVFVLPEEEIEDYLLWRLRDSRKNAISATASSIFPHKELHEKTSTERLEMLGDEGFDLVHKHYRRYSGAVCARRMVGNPPRRPWAVNPVKPNDLLGKNGVWDSE
jgi:tRNA(His) guanylyltransferase